MGKCHSKFLLIGVDRGTGRNAISYLNRKGEPVAIPVDGETTFSSACRFHWTGAGECHPIFWGHAQWHQSSELEVKSFKTILGELFNSGTVRAYARSPLRNGHKYVSLAETADGYAEIVVIKPGDTGRNVRPSLATPAIVRRIPHKLRVTVEKHLQATFKVKDIEIAAFRHMKDIVQKHFKVRDNKVASYASRLWLVDGVPASTPLGARRMTTEAICAGVGMDASRVILGEEPVLVLLYYRFQTRDEREKGEEPAGGATMALDFGAGTFDLAVMQEEDAVIRVTYSRSLKDGGGGDDVDQALQDVAGVHKEGKERWLPTEMEAYKRGLPSAADLEAEVKEVVTMEHFVYQPALVRDVLLSRLAPILTLVNHTLRSMRGKVSAFNKILVVGGASKLKVIQELVDELDAKLPDVMDTLEEEDSMVSHGAVLYGAHFLKHQLPADVVAADKTVVNVLSLPVGIDVRKTERGNIHDLSQAIHANTAYPAIGYVEGPVKIAANDTGGGKFRATGDFNLKVLQGESWARSVVLVEAEIPPAPDGMDHVVVGASLDVLGRIVLGTCPTDEQMTQFGEWTHHIEEHAMDKGAWVRSIHATMHAFDHDLRIL